MRYWLLLLLLLTACNPLRPQPAELNDIPASYTVQGAPDALQPGERWWLDFDTPQLNHLADQLFSGNLSLHQALYRLDQLDSTIRTGRAARLPSVSVNGKATRNQTSSASGESRATTTSLSLAAGYEIDLWNRLRDAEQAAILRSEAGRKDIEALLLSLSAQLCEQYFLAVEQNAQLDLLEVQIAKSSALLDFVTERYRSGLSTAAEVYQARQNLASFNAEVPAYRLTLTQAENAIATMLGSAPGAVRIDSRELAQLNAMPATGLPADLLTRRPDVAAALLELQASDADLAAALADRLPGIDLSATFGESATRLATGDYSGTVWSLALGLAQPLYDGGRLKAASDQKAAARNIQLAATNELLLSAIQEVENALIGAKQNGETALLLEERRRISEANLQLQYKSYLYGLTDSSDLLAGEISHFNILSQQLSSRQQLISQRISLVRALGGSWMTEELNNQRQALATERDKDHVDNGN